MVHRLCTHMPPPSFHQLYDLMTMGFKHQIISCTSPTQLLQVTLNHMETVRGLVEGESPLCVCLCVCACVRVCGLVEGESPLCVRLCVCACVCAPEHIFPRM